ncbi:MAG: hypothetical protein IPM57_00145 [Oligoflexia bacterium]|nr:hypothetical protein [Oligoflexia bacterium]
MRHLRKTLTLIIVLFFNSSCSIFGGGDEEVGTKNRDIKYAQPKAPYKQLLLSSADAVWQSQKTGSTIAINSLCNKEHKSSLNSLKKNILSGIDDLKIESSKRITYNQSEAEKIIAHGTTEKVPIKVSVLIFKKRDCTFDIAYISRASLFSKEISVFETFLEGLVVP